MAQGVPDSQGISHPKSFPFYVSETNPNVNGGTLCECPAPMGPFVVFPGDMFDVANPRPVLCAACAELAVALLEGKPLEIPDPAPLIELSPDEVTESEDPEGL